MLFRRAPEAVFTPGELPIKAMFARREEPDDQGVGLQDRVLRALRTPGIHLLLHGDTGVGKSTLLALAAKSQRMRMIEVNCYSTDSFDSLIERVLACMVVVREINRISSTETAGGLSKVPGASSHLNVSGTIQRKWGSSKSFEVLKGDPRDAVTKAMRATKTSIIQFDNFHNISDAATRSLFAQFIEGFSSRGKHPKKSESIAILGIAADAASLLSGSVAYTRRVRQISVPRMPDSEIKQILRKGLERLRLSDRVDDNIVGSLAFYSDGFPYYAHTLGLHLAEALRASESMTSNDALQQALAIAAQEVGASYEARYKQAVELRNTGTQPRTKILQLLSQSDKRVWTGSDVSSDWAVAFGLREEYSFLFAALGTLTQSQYGEILKRTGTTGRYEYQFSDPHLRPFIRMKLAAESASAGTPAVLQP